MKAIYIILLALLGSLGVQAQTAQPNLPSGSERYSQTLWIAPDSTLWTGKSGNYTRVATNKDLRDLAAQGYTRPQVDSAITAQIGLINFPVTSVNSMTGDVVIAPTDIGLGNVDNTSDVNKPISTATQDALDGKEDKTNKVTSLTTPNNTTYPTTEAVKNAIDAIEHPDVTGSNGIQVNDGEISPVYGTATGTVAQGDDSRINNGQTAYGWGNHKPLGLGSLHYLDGWGYSSLTDLGGANSRATSFIGTNIQSPDGTISGFQYPFGVHINVSPTIRGDIIISQSSNRLAFRSQGRAFTEVWTSNNFTPPVAFTRADNGLVPAPGGSGTTRFLREDGTWGVPSGGGGGGTATDLSVQNRTSTTLDIGSSTGTAATIPVATASLGGLMSATDKQTLGSAITFEEDPQVPSYVKSITTGNIANWNTAYTRGNFRTFGLGDALATPPGNLDTLFYSGFYYTSNVTLNRPYDYANVISISGGVTSGTQLFIPITSGNSIVYRRKTTTGSWSSFINVWDSSNFTPSNYLTTANFTWSNLSGKPTSFTPSAHTHNASDIDAGTLAMARIPTGTTGSTVALGNDSRINNGQTAYGWGDHRPFGLGSLDYNQGWGYSSLTSLAAGNALATSFIGTGESNPSGNKSGFAYPFGVHINVSSTIRGDIIMSHGSNRLAFRTAGRPFTEVWTEDNFNPSNYMPTSWTISAGSGLTGGGSGAANRTLAVDASVVRTTGTQTIDGVKQFVDVVTVPTPFVDNQAANKEYVDTQIAAAVSGIVKVGTPFSTASPASMPPAYIVYTNVSVPEAETSDNVIVNVTGNDWRAGMAVSACVNSTGVVGVSITNASSSSIATDGSLSFYISLIK